MWERRRSWCSDWQCCTWFSAATVTLETADVAWPRATSTATDGDTAALPLSERLPALAGAAGG